MNENRPKLEVLLQKTIPQNLVKESYNKTNISIGILLGNLWSALR
jgi:hypothetical protein